MFGYRTEARTIVDEAIDRSRHVGGKADRINVALNRYLDAPDPFREFATDVVNRRSEALTRDRDSSYYKQQ